MFHTLDLEEMGFVEGSLMEMEEENEDQWDPFEDEDLFIGEEESEEF
jgi:uncharacterized protein YaiE (UPF0345 family)